MDFDKAMKAYMIHRLRTDYLYHDSDSICLTPTFLDHAPFVLFPFHEWYYLELYCQRAECYEARWPSTYQQLFVACQRASSSNFLHTPCLLLKRGFPICLFW